MSTPTVLKECQHFLRVAQLYKKSPIKFGQFKVPLSVVQCIFLFPFFTFAPFLCWFCYEKEFDLTLIPGAMSLALGSAQILLVYISLAVNNSKIIETVTEFQQIVDQSWWFSELSFFLSKKSLFSFTSPIILVYRIKCLKPNKSNRIEALKLT